MPQDTQTKINEALRQGYPLDEVKAFLLKKGIDPAPYFKIQQKESSLKETPPSNFKPPEITPYNISPTKIDLKPEEPSGIGPAQTPLTTLRKRNYIEVMNDLQDKLRQSFRVGATTVAGIGAAAGATALGQPEFAPLAASSGMAITDELLRKAGNEPTSAPVDVGTLGNIAQQTVINELGGKLFSSFGRAASEAITPGSVIGPIYKYEPTYSQMGTRRTTSQILEDVLAPTQKLAQLAKQKELTQSEAENLIQRITTINTRLGEPVNVEGRLIQTEAKQNYQKVTQLASQKAEEAKLIANTNVFTHVPSNTQIKGPIDATQTVQQALDIVNDFKTGAIRPEAGDRLIRTAQNILNEAGVIVDPQTGAISHQIPLSFESAWEFKKSLGNYAADQFDNRASFLASEYRNLTRNLNQDIENSIQTWPNNSQDALAAWHDAKRMIGAREAAFFPENVEGKYIGKLALKNVMETAPSINATIDNVDKLQKALLTGDLNALVQHPGGTISSIADTNLKRELGAYQVKRMMQESGGDTKKLLENWNNPNMQENFKILYNKTQREAIGNFFNTIDSLSQKMQSGGSIYLKLRLATGVIYAGSSLARTIATGEPVSTGGVAGIGVVSLAFSGHYLGRLLISPKTAPLIQAMVSGGPLNMSVEAANRILAQNLRGAAVDIIYDNGTSKKAVINNDGKAVPLKQKVE